MAKTTTTAANKKHLLTDKQRLFVFYYVGQARCNGTQAVRLAGYKGSDETLRAVAHENLTKPHIRAAIEEMFEEVAMSANEVLLRLGEHARGNIRPFLVESEGGHFVDLSTDEAQENLHLLKKAKFKRRQVGSGDSAVVETEIEIELHDPQAALVHIGRHHKLFTDKIAGDEENPLQVNIVRVPAKQSAEEWQKMAKGKN